MPEKHLLTIDRASAADPDWATLTERALDDVSRIVRSEAHMLQTSIGAAMEARIDNVVVRLTTVIAMVCGAICILCASILLLHLWLPWWQSFGIMGVGILAAGIVSRAMMTPLGQMRESARDLRA